jgi:hypothetical protein
MAADAAGITMGDAVCHRTMSTGHRSDATMGRHLEVTIAKRPWPNRSYGLISDAETRADTRRPIRHSRPGTTVRLTSQFRMACVSPTEGARAGQLLKPVRVESAGSEFALGAGALTVLRSYPWENQGRGSNPRGCRGAKLPEGKRAIASLACEPQQ